ncbi:MAG TPA: hypothetical protein VNK05_05000, partial [Chloroflexota bacterium]|nr:hypothetical protein [Chloroflexota bacterium]
RPGSAPAPAQSPAGAAAQRSLRIERNTDGLADETVRDLPVAPGVYVFRDDNGRVLFVGTADSLRDQIASHFLPDPDRGEPNSPWADQATAVEHTAADCELDAMLLAAERLRSIHPAFRQRGARRYSPMLRFVGGTFLRAEPSHAVEPGETYHFGPYRSEAELRHTVQTVRRVFQIRTCSRRLPARRPAMRIPCERLAQGLCPAPCADLVTPEQYEVLVDLAHLFISAGKAAALQAIQSRLDALEAGDGAGGWEHTILAECRTRLLRVRKEYRPLPGGYGGGGLVMTYPTADGRLAVFYVQDGQFLARFRVSADEAAGGGLLPLIEAHLSAQGAPSDLDLAQTNVLLRWIFQHAGDPSLAPVLPEHGPDGLGGVIVERIRQHFIAPGEAPTGAPSEAPAPDAAAGAPETD